ncbi:cytochrome b562 [Arsukibacterium sp.]|uniref:cytochrome b562 n=1 Tax=Arsukibacterium sp. TaxID=1977258 RepID=UPI002FDA651A
MSTSSFLLCMALLGAGFMVQAKNVNLETTMKTMGFVYKQASETSDPAELGKYVAKLQDLVQDAKRAPLPSDKAEIYLQGLNKVLVVLDDTARALAAEDMALAQQQLKQVEKLRQQYHRERRFSIWRMIFGRY